ncbi:hypothetical protein TNCV_2492851 [Trichonephila clavipes]|uniref:Uncharacterized protein n=1 Tax=Trichonephila clavipes TaxID=2585209 RepID=A0A8X6VAK7_TRICX|nr:hypothetical protein TNCV_2492851 [Trichonephila clavipes]
MVGFCNQRLMDSSMTMETKQMSFLVDGNYRNNSTGCLSEHGVCGALVQCFRISLDITRRSISLSFVGQLGRSAFR